MAERYVRLVQAQGAHAILVASASCPRAANIIYQYMGHTAYACMCVCAWFSLCFHLAAEGLVRACHGATMTGLRLKTLLVVRDVHEFIAAAPQLAGLPVAISVGWPRDCASTSGSPAAVVTTCPFLSMGRLARFCRWAVRSWCSRLCRRQRRTRTNGPAARWALVFSIDPVMQKSSYPPAAIRKSS